MEIQISAAEADKIVKAITMSSQVLNAAVIGEDNEDAGIHIDGNYHSVRAIDDRLLAAVRIIRSKQGR